MMHYGHFIGEIVNRGNLDKTPDGLVALWNHDHPDDAVMKSKIITEAARYHVASILPKKNVFFRENILFGEEADAFLGTNEIFFQETDKKIDAGFANSSHFSIVSLLTFHVCFLYFLSQNPYTCSRTTKDVIKLKTALPISDK